MSEERTVSLFSVEVGRVKMFFGCMGILMMLIKHPSQPDFYPEDGHRMSLRNILTNLYYTVWKFKKKYWKVK
jgi:hypothetical protein